MVAQEAASLGADVKGYDSFWACNEGEGTQRQGLNGVATFARAGLVHSADSAPLGQADLDREGRCLLTDFGPFVIFNVYVPNNSGGGRLPYKMRWLHALRAAMAKQRALGKAVILAGDLNMKARPADSHWSYRTLRPHGILAQAEDLPEPVRDVASKLLSCWPKLCATLRRREARPLETKNSRTGQVYNKWALFVHTDDGEAVRLGPPFDSEEQALGSYATERLACGDDGVVRAGADSEDLPHVLREGNGMHALELFECLRNLAGFDVAPSVQRQLADLAGECPSAPEVRSWIRAVIEEDRLVDSFAHFHGETSERFTCWDQYRNKRFENVGTRIDYILVDHVLFQHAQRGAALASGRCDPASDSGALAAATLDGLSEPSGFAGGGLGALSVEEYEAQFRPPSTGIVYTPPQLSDHVGVSLLLTSLDLRENQLTGARTPKCQPHRSGKRITDFFGAKRCAATTEGAPAKRLASS
jgi:exonuclease III